MHNNKGLGLQYNLALAGLIGLLLLVACGAREFEPDGGWSGVIDGGDVVYVGTMDRQVLALDAEEGLRRNNAGERAPIAEFPEEPDKESTEFLAIYGTPTLVGGRIYVGGFNGAVYALNAQSLESTNTVFEVDSAETSKGIVGAVVVEDGKVIFGAAENSENGRLYVLDANSLSEICRFPARKADPIGKVWSTPTIADGVAYFGDLAHGFHAVVINSCSPLWPAPVELDGGIASTPLVREGTVYVGTFNRSFYAINIATGVARLLFKADNWFWSGVVTDGEMLFIPNLDGKLYAMDLASELVVWEFDTDGPILSTPTIVGAQVVVASDAERLYVVDIRSGTEVWSRQLSGKVRAPLAARGNVVYLSVLDHTIQAIDVAKKTEHWDGPVDTRGNSWR